MVEEHANVSLLKRLDVSNMAAAADLFTQDVIWHFFDKISARTDDTFKVEPISMTAVGDELIVTHTKNTMTLQGRPIATDVVVVWRIVDGRIAEVWDIPSVHDVFLDPTPG